MIQSLYAILDKHLCYFVMVTQALEDNSSVHTDTVGVFEGPRDPSPTSRILYRDNTRPRQSFFRHATLGSKTPNFQDPAPSDILRVF